MKDHTQECKDANAAWDEHVKEFLAKYPKSCPTCGGWGYFISRGSSVPYGSTWVSLPDEADPCPDCAELGLCPHCGEEALNEDCTKCSACGWEEGDEGIQEPPGCCCPDEEMIWDE